MVKHFVDAYEDGEWEFLDTEVDELISMRVSYDAKRRVFNFETESVESQVNITISVDDARNLRAFLNMVLPC